MDDLGVHRRVAAGGRRAPERPRATTHWLQYDLLRPYGVTPVAERIVRQGKIITAAGVSAGIDMALMLAGEIAGPELGARHPAGHRVRPRAAVRGWFARNRPAEIVELVKRARDRDLSCA